MKMGGLIEIDAHYVAATIQSLIESIHLVGSGTRSGWKEARA